jgi:predicted nucleic acid-binding protein
MMQLICSDTNIWLDFEKLKRIDWPFRLDCTYIMSAMAIDDEVLSPADLSEKLISAGLMAVDMTDDELALLEQYTARHRRISTYDAIAMAISKGRGIILLTGDKALKNAANAEGIEVHGLLWIIDQLLEADLITASEHNVCMIDLKNNPSGRFRLPAGEIELRILDK